ncbi:MAG: apolipoprotein N-acyltransferase [Rhizobiales bacterium]|nr:apolipoprotein N-acyltransferase [Hyphomicrobiales bacterium]
MIRLAHFFRTRRGWQRFFIALSAGALAGLALPPLDIWPTLFAAFPVLVWLIDGLPMRRPLTAFATGWAFGAGYFSVCLYWVGAAFLVDASTYLWMMPFAVGALAGGMALYWGVAVAVANFVWRPGLSRLLLLAVAVATVEWLRGHLMTGFPWAAPGLAVIGMDGLAQLASLVGMTSLTLLIVLWAALPALLFERDLARREAMLAIILFALLPAAWGWGAWRLAQAQEKTVAGVMIRIVQPNIPQGEKWLEGNADTIFGTLLELSTEGGAEKRFSHIIWPESAVPFYFEESTEARDIIGAMLGERGILITGGLRRDRSAEGERRVFNSIMGFDGAGNLILSYDKWRLVPGGEFLPLEWLLKPMGFRKVVTVPESFNAGQGPKTAPVAGAPDAGFLICYEVIFPDGLIDPEHRPGWIVNVTNDGWFGRTSGPYQHLAQVQLRAIEQGVPVIRSANSGISAVVDPYGQVIQSLPLGERGVLDTALPVSLEPPPYSRVGDLILVVVAGLAIAMVVGLSLIHRWADQIA